MNRKTNREIGGVALGAGVGLVLGALFGNPGIGLVVGAAAGVVLGWFDWDKK